MNLNYTTDDISLSPFKKEMIGYTWTTFKDDFLAAITVALLTLPQAIAAALLAGLPLSSGIFAAIYSSILASIFGSSSHLIIGPSNAIAILIQAGTSEILYNHYRGVSGLDRELMAMQILTQLTFLIGFFQILAASCKLGRLTQFVSYSVIVGYIFGTALAMLLTQATTLLGIESMRGVHSLFERGVYILSSWKDMHIPTAIVGVGSLVLLVVLRKTRFHIQSAVIVLVSFAVLVYILKLQVVANFLDQLFNINEYQSVKGILLVQDTAEISATFPSFSLFSFNTGIMNELVPVAFAISLLGVMESTFTGKSIAACSGQGLSVNQEIFALGLGNLLSSLIGAMPVSGSATRSTANYSLGAKTRMAAILCSVIIAICIYSFSSFITKIPLAAFAALLLVTASTLVNKKQFLLCMKATNSDALVLGVTIISCLFFSLDMAFYIGVILSIILYLKKAAVPQLVEFDFDKTGELINLNLDEEHEHRSVRFIKVEGELFFGSADIFHANMKSFSEDDHEIKVIILQIKNARDIDATSCLALEQLNNYLVGSGRHLIVCGITAPLWDVFCDSGLVESIGRDNMFTFDERHPHHYILKALSRAYELANLTEEAFKPIPSVTANEPLVQPKTVI